MDYKYVATAPVESVRAIISKDPSTIDTSALLHLAAASSRDDIIHLVLQNGADIERIATVGDMNNVTPLMMAAGTKKKCGGGGGRISRFEF